VGDVSAAEIVRDEDLFQIGDVETLATIVDSVIAANPGAVAKYRAGGRPILNFLVGRVLEASGGRANLSAAEDLLSEALDGAGSSSRP
jgi:aspartyl-tRNA(Asn)/glutamyl-tRNA(Gln) amidotransferase subunit B